MSLLYTIRQFPFSCSERCYQNLSFRSDQNKNNSLQKCEEKDTVKRQFILLYCVKYHFQIDDDDDFQKENIYNEKSL